MKASVRVKRTSNRTCREDGDATKARIIAVAGRLFAERGFAETTSKEICEQAQTNITAVNYHFGSREGLYQTVVREMRENLVSPRFLEELDKSDLEPKEKLARLLDQFVSNLHNSNGWQIRLWARETVSPSAIAIQLMHQEGAPKFLIIKKILSQITGIPMDDPDLDFCFLHVMSPFMVVLMIGSGTPSPHKSIIDNDEETIATNLKDFIFAGLAGFSALRAQRRKTPMHVMNSPT